MTKLEELRRKAGLTQRELSTKSGVSLPTISKIENGGINTAQGWTLLSLARALNVNVGELF